MLTYDTTNCEDPRIVSDVDELVQLLTSMSIKDSDSRKCSYYTIDDLIVQMTTLRLGE